MWNSVLKNACQTKKNQQKKAVEIKLKKHLMFQKSHVLEFFTADFLCENACVNLQTYPFFVIQEEKHTFLEFFKVCSRNSLWPDF